MKLRVWHIPQVPMKTFYVPVNNAEEGKKVMDVLAAYDLFQLENNIKPDFANMSGLEMFDEDEQEWIGWVGLDVIHDNYYDNVDNYFKNDEQMLNFTNELFKQLKQIN